MRSALLAVFCVVALTAASQADAADAAATVGACAEERARIGALERALASCLEVRAGGEEAAGREPEPGKATRAVWSRLRRGQSRADVLRILGEPGRVVGYAGFERWEYPDLRGGRVHFDDRGRAMGWRPPPQAPRGRAGAQ